MKKNKKVSNNSSYVKEYYFTEIGVGILFLIAAFLFGQKIGLMDFFIFVAIIISFFVISLIIIFLTTRTTNAIQQYFKSRK